LTFFVTKLAPKRRIPLSDFYTKLGVREGVLTLTQHFTIVTLENVVSSPRNRQICNFCYKSAHNGPMPLTDFLNKT